MSDPALVGKKVAAVRDKIRAMANESGYGHFISDGTCEQWAAILVSTVDDIENPPGFSTVTTTGSETVGSTGDPNA